MIFLLRKTALAAFDADDFAGFVRAVLHKGSYRRTAVGEWGKFVGAHIGLAHVVEVIGHGKPVAYFKTYVDAVVQCIFNAYAKGKADGHGVVGLAVGIGGCALAFGAERTKKYFSAVEISIGIVAEHTYTQCYIRSEIVVGISGNEFEEIEIALQSELENI